MSAIAQHYAVPSEIDQFIDQGFLEVLTERPDRMTVEFHIPSRVTVDQRNSSPRRCRHEAKGPSGGVAVKKWHQTRDQPQDRKGEIQSALSFMVTVATRTPVSGRAAGKVSGTV